MKIKITRGTVAKGQPVEAGALLDVSDSEGRLLIGLKKAVVFVEPKVPAAIETPEPEIDNREDEMDIETPDPESKSKRGRPRKR